MPTFTVNGQRIYARVEGPASGQLALLIHGWSSSWYALSPLMPLLSRRFRCLAVDLPGYGNSPRPNKTITIKRYANTLAELINQLSERPAVLVGHSMGGMIGITIALRYPMLVERMVLLAPTISGQLSFYINTVLARLAQIERTPIGASLMRLVENQFVTLTDRLLRPASFAERSTITEQEFDRIKADIRRPGQGQVRAQCYWAMRQNDLRGKLSQIETPSLVVWGAEDNTVPLRDASVVADEWPAADLRILPKAGHWPQFETPEATRRQVASFLGLPLITTRLDDSNTPAAVVDQAAQFLAHSDVGNGLNLAQRTRLASQCRMRAYAAGQQFAGASEASTELYIVQAGTVEVWSAPAFAHDNNHVPERLATMLPGQIAGELALLDGGLRSAALRAGPEGATVLTIKRDRLMALCDDDPPLGTRVVWNIATALGLRLRLMNWRQQLESRELGGNP